MLWEGTIGVQNQFLVELDMIEEGSRLPAASNQSHFGPKRPETPITLTGHFDRPLSPITLS